MPAIHFPQEVRGGEGGARAAAASAGTYRHLETRVVASDVGFLCCLYIITPFIRCSVFNSLFFLPFWVTLPAVEVVCSSPSLSQFCAFNPSKRRPKVVVVVYCGKGSFMPSSSPIGEFRYFQVLIFRCRCRGVWKPRPLCGGTYPPPSTSLLSEFHCKE